MSERVPRTPGFDWRWVVSWVDRWYVPTLLIIWFGVQTFISIRYLAEHTDSLAFDLRLYRLAAETWLAGGDPWAAGLYWDAAQPSISYAGPPVTLLPFLLVAWVPEPILILVFMLLAGATAMWTLRRVGLPMWWMLFPPIAHGIWVANLNIFVVALLVLGGTKAGAIATTFKVYAALPLVILGRPRPVVWALVIAIVTLPFLPWTPFFRQYAEISRTLAEQAWGGQQTLLPWPAPILVVIALFVLGPKMAAWLVVPVLWPATQLHYTVLALPAMTRFLGFAGAVHQPGLLGIAVIVLALVRLGRALVSEEDREDLRLVAVTWRMWATDRYATLVAVPEQVRSVGTARLRRGSVSDQNPDG